MVQTLHAQRRGYWILRDAVPQVNYPPAVRT